MLFNSLAYAIFLPLVFILYWVIPSKYRWCLILVASYYFYMSWNPKYVVLIAFTTIISYICAILLEKFDSKFKKNTCVAITLIACLGVLFVFKYFNFFVENITAFFPTVQLKELNLLLPVGISFYTFQTLSYVIDVYRGDCKAEKNIGIYAAFVSFFPQLVAGPIERANNLLPQIRKDHKFSSDDVYYGIELIAWGLFKKILVADNLATYVDLVYSNIYDFSGGSILIATIFFTIQIYCDFSGYSDIARGSAKLFGITLMDNFKSPYFSTSIREFWSRWHISLSSWFRDYVYIPMGGSRVPQIRICLNVLFTFLVSGLWHGANWTFVMWGCLHGLAQIYENAFGIKKAENERDLFTWIRRIVVFFFVALAWVFFRANSIHDGFQAVKAIFDGITHIKAYLSCGFSELGISVKSIPLLILYILPLSIYDYFALKTDPIVWIRNRKKWIQHTLMIIIIFLILFLGYAGKSTFVYFQF